MVVPRLPVAGGGGNPALADDAGELVGGAGRRRRRALERGRGLVAERAADVGGTAQLCLLRRRGQQQLQRRGRRGEDVHHFGGVLHAAEGYDRDIREQPVPLRDVLVGIELGDVALQSGGDGRLAALGRGVAEHPP